MSVRGISGNWRDLVTALNVMAGTITMQFRAISEVTTAIATGDLSRKIVSDSAGEIKDLQVVINEMVDMFNCFASEITFVCRGRTSPAVCPNAQGTWKDLIENINEKVNVQ